MAQQKIYELDELLSNQSTEQASDVKKQTSVRKKTTRTDLTAKELNKEKGIDTLTTRSFLSSISNEKLRRYIKKLSNFKTLEKQEEILRTKLKEYKKLNDQVNHDKTKDLLSKIAKLKSEFISVFKTSDEKVSGDKRREIIDSSVEIKALKEDIKNIKKELELIKPNVLIRKMIEYRRRMKLIIDDSDDLDEDVVYDIDDDDDLESLTKTNKETSDLLITYHVLCDRIAKLIGEDKEFVLSQSSGKLRTLLKERVNVDSITQMESEVTKKDFQLKIEISRLCGDHISEVIYDNFDLTDDEQMNDALDIIASSKTKFVSSIAYVLCRKYNMMHEFDEALGFGMLALSEALVKWKSYQMLTQVPINIDLFLGITIAGPIQRGIYNIRNKGMMNDGVSIKNDTERRANVLRFKEDNPDLKDMTIDQIEQIYNYYLYANGMSEGASARVYSESQMADAIASAIEENEDSFVNTLVDDKFMNRSDEGFEYDDIITSIKKFFTLFKKKYDKTTGDMVVSAKKRYFDKWDLAILEMLLAIEPNPNNDKGRWSQKEIAIELNAKGAAEGVTFSQPAISDRLNKFWINLDKIKEEYPGLTPAIEFFKTYFASTDNNKYFEDRVTEEREQIKQIFDGIYETLKS